MNAYFNDTSSMLTLLGQWVEKGWLREVDLALARFFNAEVADCPPALLLSTALVSHQLGRGHVCLDLESTLQDPYMVLSLPPEQDDSPTQEPTLQPKDLLAGIQLSDWLAALHHAELTSDGTIRTPLVLVGHRLYLRRYWRYERQIEEKISQRLLARHTLQSTQDQALVRALLDTLFPRDDKTPPVDWQKIACAIAAHSAFSIITGGPGTGKTTTVVKLLALLQSIALANASAIPLTIRLAAPTGKAAARLKESISGAIAKLPETIQHNAPLIDAIPTEVTTLHRLLGTKPDSSAFRHNARNPLPLDILVVDESSMVDIEMMASLLMALPPHARLILLGDKDQLASVEAGSVLGELCRRAEQGHFTPEAAQWLKAITGEQIDRHLIDANGRALDQHIAMLRTSYRFTAASGIGQLASAVNAGDKPRIHGVWAANYADLNRQILPNLDAAALQSLLLGQAQNSMSEKNPRYGFAHYLKTMHKSKPSLASEKAAFDVWAKSVLEAYTKFQLLTALRNGPYGVAGMNERVESLLAEQRLIHPTGSWYEGRPVLVTQNDYRLGLMNGDIGISLAYPVMNKATGAKEWSLRVAFLKTDGSGDIHWVLPSRLLAIETVYALTVHKSQGSEFSHCAILLPPDINPILTRELIYTAITRGKENVWVLCVGNAAIIEEAASRTVQRTGGLFT